MLEELLIKIRAVTATGGFDEAKAKLEGLSKATESTKTNAKNASQEYSNFSSSIKGKVGGAFDSIKSAGSNAMSTIKSKVGGALSSVKEFIGGLSGIESGLMSVMGAVGLGSLFDTVVGTSSKAEVNQILTKNMTQTAEGAKRLYETIDQATNKTLVSMQSVIPAVNAFRASTGATEGQLVKVSPRIAEFGSYVYAMTGSSARAETAMFDLSKGLKGLYASLDQYGITEESLMKTGLWSGRADDVEGYMAAVNKVTGSTEELMGTFQGLQATIGKVFSIAGKKIGAVVLPVLKTVMEAFLGLDKALGGNLSTGILVVIGVISLLTLGLGALGAIVPLVTSGLTAFTVALPGLAGALGLTAVVTETAAGAVTTLSISFTTLLTTMLPIIAILAVLAAALGGVYLLLQQNTSAMREYKDFLKNGEQQINALREASDAYKSKAEQLTKVKNRLAAQGKDTTNIEKQIADAYRKSAEAAKEAEEAEKVLKTAREKRAIHDLKVNKAREHYEKAQLDRLYEMDVISEDEHKKGIASAQTAERGATEDYESLQRMVRIHQIGGKQFEDIKNKNDSYSKAWKNDVEGLNAYNKAWEELGDAVYDLNQADDPGQTVMAWGRIAWLKASIWIGEMNHLFQGWVNDLREWMGGIGSWWDSLWDGGFAGADFWDFEWIKTPVKDFKKWGEDIGKQVIDGIKEKLKGFNLFDGLFGSTGTLSFTLPGFTLPSLVWPSMEMIFEEIKKRIPAIGKLTWPTIQQIFNEIKRRLPRISKLKWPTATSILAAIRNRLPSIPKFQWPSAGQILNAIKSKIPKMSAPSLNPLSWFAGSPEYELNDEYYGKGYHYEGSIPAGTSSTSTIYTTNVEAPITINATLDSPSRVDDLAKQLTVYLSSVNDAKGR